MACALAGVPAHAEVLRFEFSQFFTTGSVGAMTVTGSFEGELDGTRIGNLSNIHIFRDGIAFRGNGALFTAQFDTAEQRWRKGGYLSLDGSDNNVMFIDTDYPNGDAGFFNYFFSVTGIGNAAFQPSFYRYRVPETKQLTVKLERAVGAVPEPSAWAALVLGFGVLGAGMRARRRPAPRPVGLGTSAI